MLTVVRPAYSARLFSEAVTHLSSGHVIVVADLAVPADYALLRAALGHQRDDSQISLFWLSGEGRTALQVRAMEGGSQV